MIEILSKHKAKLIVSVGSGKKRKRFSKVVEYQKKKDLPKMYVEFESECLKPPLTDATVEELVTSYIDHCKVLGAKDTTIHGYETAKKRIIKQFGDVLATDLTAYQVENFISSMAKKYQPKTIGNTIGLLSAAYERAVRTGQLKSNPATQVALPKQKQKEVDIFTEEEVLKFLDELKNERLDFSVGFRLALLCGLRRSEILGLREEHINIPFKVISISETRHRVGTDEVIQDTKSENSYRTLALPDTLIDDISELIEEHHTLPYVKSDYLIQDGFGQPLNPSTFSNRIYKIEKRAGLPRVSLHDLRHTFASMLNNAQIDIARISKELGHSRISTTFDLYTHVFGGVSASSRGIANVISEKTAPNLPLIGNEKASER